MRRFIVVGRKKSVWFLLGAVVYVFIILLGLGNMVVSLVSITEKELPIYSVQREEALVALTFNCAWEENDIPQLLDLLERENIKATFFLVGQWIERYPDSVRQIVDAGHEIGNHSYSHVDFVGAGEEVIRQQMEKTDALIRVLLSEKPTEVSSSSPEARIFEICSLTVACLTSNNTSSLHIQSFSSFYHSILLFRHQFFKPGTLDNNKLVCAFPFLQHFIHPEQTRTLARHNKQPSSNNRGIFFTLNSMKSRNYHSIFISKLLTD